MSLGKIKQFDVTKDDWNLYIDRLEQYFLVNSVEPELQVSILITVMGGEAYALLDNLCTPVKPAKKDYKELVAIMKKHLKPEPGFLAERYKFRQRVQRTDESVAEYVAELKRLSKYCKFTAESILENLRDQFVCGLVNESTRQRLFTMDDVKFDRAYQVAVSMEAAETDAAVVEGRRARPGDVTSSASSSVHMLARDGRRERAGEGGNKNVLRGSSGVSGTHYTARSIKSRAPLSVGGGPSDMSAAGSGNRVPQYYEKNKHNRSRSDCTACGGQHETKTCKFQQYVCRVCNRQGHLKRMCPNLRGGGPVFNMTTEEVELEEISRSSSEASDEVNNFSIDSNALKMFGPYTIDVCIEGYNVMMEIDTGSAISVISKDCYDSLFAKKCVLKKSDLTLRYYTGEIVKPLGKITPLVTYGSKNEQLDLYIVEHGKANLLGRQWLRELGIIIKTTPCHAISSTKQIFNLSAFSSRYCEVFADGLGRYTGGAVGFRLRPDARPVYLRARPLAYALREPVERALDQMVQDGIISPVNTSDWATPIVPVMKKDGTIRVCADFKLTLNKCLEVDRFPLPKVEDLLTKLHGGEKFTKLDLSQAYAQFELDDSKKYTVINTHRGLFMYNRLIYGLASSPGIFQRKIEQLFADIPNVGVFLDDVIITGRNDVEHVETLHRVFERLQKYGLNIKKEKCSFLANSVTYLGFVITKNGVHTCPEKIDAIKKAPRPNNVSELRSFLGLVMYYAKFIPDLSTILSPLYNLLKKEVSYDWNEQCNQAFNKIKNVLLSSQVLTHYSPDLPLILTTDASSVGVGAVISHMTPTGERPIAYASRVLNSAEKSYSQIEREALAIIYGVRKFHQYLYGRNFTMRTDHKPLVTIFGNKVGIPVMAASRMQRWAVILAGYNYDIEYVRSEKNAADALSRLPVDIAGHATQEVTYINFIQKFLPVTKEAVKKAYETDKILRRVYLYIQTGWPSHCTDDNIKPYFQRRKELYIDLGCIIWGYRLVIPKELTEKLLAELHVGHMGIVKMKCMARSMMWWPGIDADIENTCRACGACVAEATAPHRAPPQPWPYMSEPWSRLHVDFLGPFHGKTFFVLIDSTSKWLEIFLMPRTTAATVLKVLRETFARFGLPKEMVSDNGPPFSSKEYVDFMENNGIKVTYTPIYHPSSNGAAEGAVKLCKRVLKKALREHMDIDVALQAYLLAYRNVEHATTGVSPAVLLQRRNLRSRLDLLRGECQVGSRVLGAQSKQVEHAGGTNREFKIGDAVMARSYAGGRRWLSGTVKDVVGSRMYIIDRKDGPPIKRHVDQLKRNQSGLHCPVWDVTAGEGNSNHDSWTQESVPSVPTRSTQASQTSPSSGSQIDRASLVSPVAAPGPVLRPRDQLKPARRYGFEID